MHRAGSPGLTALLTAGGGSSPSSSRASTTNNITKGARRSTLSGLGVLTTAASHAQKAGSSKAAAAQDQVASPTAKDGSNVVGPGICITWTLMQHAWLLGGLPREHHTRRAGAKGPQGEQ